jgi:aspartyl-tRNA(Asn)/glutamyl-tRNA(Gln) amidotransferase subunit C
MSGKHFDVEYVAELARIKLSLGEIKTFESQLGQVLEHVAKLNEVDVSQVEPMAHSFAIYNVFREDEIRPSLDREDALANAPHRAQGLFIVTKVVE